MPPLRRSKHEGGPRCSWRRLAELLAHDPAALAERDLVAIDGIDRADARRAGVPCSRSSTDCAIAAAICSSRAGCRWSHSALREDLRTRLGWGLVYEVTPLADADKPAALAAYARGRGFRLADDVIQYLLAHGRRDMPALVGALGRTGSAFARDQASHHGPAVARLAAAATSTSIPDGSAGVRPALIPGVNRVPAEAVNGGNTRIAGCSTNRQEVPPRSRNRSPRPRLPSSQ